MTTEENFEKVYNNFKIHLYKEIFSKIHERETSLTTVETFCMEVIYALGRPTINEFATFIGISTPNSAYKVGNLVKKGYLRKIQSREDKREYRLEVTQKYMDYYNLSSRYMKEIVEKVEQSMTSQEIADFNRCLDIIAQEQEKSMEREMG